MAKDMDLGRGIREGGILVFAASAKLDNNDACFAHIMASAVIGSGVIARAPTRVALPRVIMTRTATQKSTGRRDATDRLAAGPTYYS